MEAPEDLDDSVVVADIAHYQLSSDAIISTFRVEVEDGVVELLFVASADVCKNVQLGEKNIDLPAHPHSTSHREEQRR